MHRKVAGNTSSVPLIRFSLEMEVWLWVVELIAMSASTNASSKECNSH